MDIQVFVNEGARHLWCASLQIQFAIIFNQITTSLVNDHLSKRRRLSLDFLLLDPTQWEHLLQRQDCRGSSSSFYPFFSNALLFLFFQISDPLNSCCYSMVNWNVYVLVQLWSLLLLSFNADLDNVNQVLNPWDNVILTKCLQCVQFLEFLPEVTMVLLDRRPPWWAWRSPASWFSWSCALYFLRMRIVCFSRVSK